MRTCIGIGFIALSAFALHTYSNRPPDPAARCNAVHATGSYGTVATVTVGNITLPNTQVDTGADKSVVPGCIMRTLADRGLAKRIGSTKIVMADSSVQHCGRWITSLAVVVGPGHTMRVNPHEVLSLEQTAPHALLGHSTLAALDLLVDPLQRTLTPRRHD